MSAFSTWVDGLASLTAHWPMAALSGTTETETKGAFNGTYVNTPTLAEPSLLTDVLTEKSVRFIRANSTRMTVVDNTYLNGDVFSIGYLLKRASIGTNMTVFDKGSTGAISALCYWTTTDIPRFAQSGSGTALIAMAAKTDITNAHFFLWTKNGATIHAYYDGVADEVAGTNATLGDSTNLLRVGSDTSSANHLDGWLQHVFVTNAALTAGDAAAGNLAFRADAGTMASSFPFSTTLTGLYVPPSSGQSKALKNYGRHPYTGG